MRCCQFSDRPRARPAARTSHSLQPRTGAIGGLDCPTGSQTAGARNSCLSSRGILIDPLDVARRIGVGGHPLVRMICSAPARSSPSLESKANGLLRRTRVGERQYPSAQDGRSEFPASVIAHMPGFAARMTSPAKDCRRLAPRLPWLIRPGRTRKSSCRIVITPNRPCCWAMALGALISVEKSWRAPAGRVIRMINPPTQPTT